LCSLILIAVVRCFAQGDNYIEFIENKGQWDKQVNFKGDMSTGAFFLRKDGFTVLMHHPDDLARVYGRHHGALQSGDGPGGGGSGPGKRPVAAAASASGKADMAGGDGGAGAGSPGDMYVRSHAYKVSFVGANEGAEIIPDKPLPTYNNYFIGRDSTRWASHCRIYQGVTYKNIYPNVDLRYYTDKGQLKYDIIVHPGGNADQIEMRFEGADKLSTRRRQLLINTSVGQVKELEPNSFQFDERGRTEVPCRYTIRNGNTVKFKVGEYASGATLVIDPTLVFASFTGSRANNWGFTATPAPDGSFYAGGIVFGSGYPYNVGKLQPTYGGGEFDVGIIKFSSNGSTALFATYLGGNDSETPHSMMSDAQGNLVVIGRTYSSNFPFKVSEGKGGGADMFVVKLDNTGSRLIGSMRIGGSGDDCVNWQDQLRSRNEHVDTLVRNYGDDSRSEIILDGSGNICIAASTQSSAPTEAAGGFPIRGNVFQKTFGGGRQDGVVLKINPDCNTILWSSFLGGSGSDAAFVLKENPMTGDLYVGGVTNSSNFPGDKTGVMQPNYAGGLCDGFLTIISGDGTTQKKMTYLGTAVADAIYGVQFDKKGFPYVMGTTNGTWPVTANVGYRDINAKQFVGKLQPDLSGYIYSTTFGLANASKPNISPVAFLVDRCENVYVSGWGGWIIGIEADPYGLTGTLGMPVTANAVKRFTDNRDFYFIVFKKDIAGLLYGTFYGQDDNSSSISEHVDGGTSRYDANGIIYQAICANCNGRSTTPFPTTPGAWAMTNGAAGTGGCNLAAVKIAFNFAGVAGGLKASVNGRNNDTSGCIPMDAVFQDTLLLAKSYIWNFGEPGGKDTATVSPVVTHTYANPGIYRVMMVAIDSATCNARDTVYRHVIARTDRAVLDFDFAKQGGCQSLDYLFSNLSTAPPAKPFTRQSFIWDFGDNTGQTPANTSSVIHSFPSPGTYNVKLILVDTAYCNWPDSLTKTVRVSPQVKAQFITPTTGCAPYLATFNNTSMGGLTFNWDFGDGTTSTNPTPVHMYATPGTYTISLTANDPTSCNKTDFTRQTILVSGRPAAAFTYSPVPPVANTPVVFTNGSTGGVRYKWIFGDGDSTVKTTTDSVMHLYIRTDTFQVCLVTYNQYECTDTSCRRVATLINPLLDVPNAFTPGRFGQNGVIRVFGFGITKMVWRIYNRWGQQVYQSDNPNEGWNGTYGGNLQPMGVYAYTLEADFSDGRHVSKKGDITLIR